MKTSLRILVLLLFAAAYAGSQVPAPQIPLTGNIGSGGIFPLFNSGTLHITTDADYVMSYPEMSASVIKVVSDVSLTAQRNLVAPLSLGFQFTIQNATTGGQSIQVIGATGTGVIIANGNITTVTSDGANYVASIGGSWPGYPSSGLAASTGSAWRTPLYTDVTALWNTCTTGFMKGDGTCPATAYTLPSTVVQTNQNNIFGYWLNTFNGTVYLNGQTSLNNYGYISPVAIATNGQNWGSYYLTFQSSYWNTSPQVAGWNLSSSVGSGATPASTFYISPQCPYCSSSTVSVPQFSALHSAFGAQASVDYTYPAIKLTGPTSTLGPSILGIQENSTTAVGVNGAVIQTNWTPSSSPSGYANASLIVDQEVNVDSTSTGTAFPLGAFVQVNNNGNTVSNTLTGMTIETNNVGNAPEYENISLLLQPENYGTGTITGAYGAQTACTNKSTGTITGCTGYASYPPLNSAGGVITDWTSFYVNVGDGTGAAPVNAHGLNVAGLTASGSAYGIYLGTITAPTAYQIYSAGTAPSYIAGPVTFVGSLIDNSGATQFKLPVHAGYASAANGEIGYDSTNLNWHGWLNGADNFLAGFPVASPPTSGHVAGFLKSTNSWSLQDLGAMPTALPPNGSASGDLSGSYPGPTVVAKYKTWSCQDGVGGGTAALATGTYATNQICLNKSGASWTIVGSTCSVDTGTGTTVTITDGSGNNLLTSALTCASGFATPIGPSSTTTIANGGYVKWTPSPDGTAKSITVTIYGTY